MSCASQGRVSSSRGGGRAASGSGVGSSVTSLGVDPLGGDWLVRGGWLNTACLMRGWPNTRCLIGGWRDYTTGLTGGGGGREWVNAICEARCRRGDEVVGSRLKSAGSTGVEVLLV